MICDNRKIIDPVTVEISGRGLTAELLACVIRSGESIAHCLIRPGVHNINQIFRSSAVHF